MQQTRNEMFQNPQQPIKPHSFQQTPKTHQESTNHPQKTNDAYGKQTTEPNASKEQTQYDNLAYEHEQAA